MCGIFYFFRSFWGANFFLIFGDIYALFDKNYWTNYTGYDLDKNGIGDIPFRPVKLFSYIVNRTPETIILLRSLFINIIDFSEKVSPVFTPDNLMDNNPLTKRIVW